MYIRLHDYVHFISNFFYSLLLTLDALHLLLSYTEYYKQVLGNCNLKKQIGAKAV